MAFVRVKSSFRDIDNLHSNLEVAFFEIQLREYDSSPQLIQKFFNDGNGEFIRDGSDIQSTIVYAKPLATLFFSY